MNSSRVVYHLARADFLERVRRYGFLVTLACAVYAAWVFVPPNGATWSTLTIRGYRGIYNSAWIGAQVAMLTTLFSCLVGFYLVKNAIDRDYQTHVGQIIAASRVSKLAYALGKMLSNVGVFLTITLVMIVVAAIMQVVRAEHASIEPLSLIVPFLYMFIPVALLISAMAVLFECVPLLRGGLGNVIFFFLIMTMLSAQILDAGDVFGIGRYLDSMTEAATVAYPDAVGPEMEMNIGIQIQDDGVGRHLETFQWDGLTFSIAGIAGRLGLVGIALVITALASTVFDRFDSSQTKQPSRRKKSRLTKLSDAIADRFTGTRNHGPMGTLTPLAARMGHSRFGTIIRAELAIMLKGLHPVWYLGALILFVLGLVLPTSAGQSVVLPISWIWPTLLWSSMGGRERRWGTHQIVFSAPRPMSGQLPSTWLAGVLVALLVGGGVGLHLAITGEFEGLGAWVVGATFVPALALACGTWTNGSRLFEAIYLFWWYAGPLNRVPALDYIGASGELHTWGITGAYLALTAILLIFALLGRRRQMMI